MELTDNSAEARLASPDNLLNRLVQHRSTERGEAKVSAARVPPEIRKLLAITGGTTQDEKAEAFGVTQAEVSNCERGLTTEKISDPKLDGVVEEKKQKAAELAQDNLFKLLNKVPDLIDSEPKLKNVTAAARDMSAIRKELVSSDKSDDVGKVIVYAPNIRREDHYETLTVIVKD